MSTRPGRQEEHEVVSELILKLEHVFVALFLLHAAVQLAVLDASILQEHTHQRQQLRELTENKHLVSGSDELRDDAVKELELARRHVKPVVDQEVVGVEEQVRVVNDLAKLHHRISETLVADLAGGWVTSQPTLLADAIVHQLLPVRELDFDHHLALRWKLFLNLTLNTPKQERSEDLVEPVDDKQLLFFRELKDR